MDEKYLKKIIAWIKKAKPTKDELTKKKTQLCRELKVEKIPTDIEIYLSCKVQDAEKVRKYLETKPTRTGSGVAIVATMSMPYRCPHGKCTFCPGGPESIFGDTPQSYTGKEPSTMRAIRHGYDSYRIVFNRLEQYVVLGQNNDKVDQIVQGGTFPAYPVEYQRKYIADSFKAYNDFSRLFFVNGKLDMEKFKEFFELPGDINDKKRTESVKAKIENVRKETNYTLEEEQKINETSAIRCIGLTIETKPDWGFAKHGLELLKLGATRIELGIQSVYDEILRGTNRGHRLADSVRSIQELRDLGFKLNFHMMPGLPTPSGVRISRKEDLESLKEIFASPEFRPDMLKIYPCMVMPGTPLEYEYKKGIFKPLSTEEAADIIVEGMSYVPEYCRVMRIQRDIPTYATSAGVGMTNLRQVVDKLAAERKVTFRDISSREIRRGIIKEKEELKVMQFDASGGKEFFISIEADDKILGFVRLRYPNKLLHPSITEKSALIRELHVYGKASKIGKNDKGAAQHKGYGRMLMQKAEEIAKKDGKNKIVIISGIGVREYYKKLGYSLEASYMVKHI